MKVICDLHVHSHYSRATSKDLTPLGLATCARQKGIQLLGTGDMTHPKWLAELEARLDSDGSGFYRLKKSISDARTADIRFVLTGEISNIYSKGGKTRRQHTVFVVPSIESMKKIQTDLQNRGANITSDGRPIIGMDVKDLLKIFLEHEPRTICVPAHIWTPWFSLFGSKSGFDSIAECFEDMAEYIWAVETGLSSDPRMNWRLSQLNDKTILSHSDAHSCDKLGREANVMELAEMTYDALYEAIRYGGSSLQKKKKEAQNANRVLRTIEFFPEEGKYHADGHRDCSTWMLPPDTKKYKGFCPKDQKPLTIGVLNRVEQLADQPPEEGKKYHPPFKSIIPLCEIIGEAMNLGPSSKKVKQEYQKLVMDGDNEFAVLLDVPLSELNHMTTPEVVEGIKRVREGKVKITPGFDGVYGKVKLFDDSERHRTSTQRNLF